jgi:hypothetical protein
MISGFTVKNWMNFKPIEDSYACAERKDGGFVLCAADGITRDPRGMPLLPKSKTDFFGMIKFFRNYERPTTAKEATDVFVYHFVTGARVYSKINEENIRDCVSEGNRALKIYNESSGINERTVDYLGNDYAACVAAGTVVSGKRDYLVGMSIADSRVRIFDLKGNIKFESPNEGPNSKGSIDEDVMKKYNAGFREPEGRRIIRQLYRNHPQEPLSYGALTGEELAMSYVRSGEQELRESDIVIVHTDGLEEAVLKPEFADALRERNVWRINKLCQRSVRTEGSLVYLI